MAVVLAGLCLYLLKLLGEFLQFVDLGSDRFELFVDDSGQLGMDVTAAGVVLGLQQPGDLAQGEPEQLRSGYERHPAQCLGAVESVAGLGPLLRLEQFELLVVAEGPAGDAGLGGHSSDRHQLLHDSDDKP